MENIIITVQPPETIAIQIERFEPLNVGEVEEELPDLLALYLLAKI